MPIRYESIISAPIYLWNQKQSCYEYFMLSTWWPKISERGKAYSLLPSVEWKRYWKLRWTKALCPCWTPTANDHWSVRLDSTFTEMKWLQGFMTCIFMMEAFYYKENKCPFILFDQNTCTKYTKIGIQLFVSNKNNKIHL